MRIASLLLALALALSAPLTAQTSRLPTWIASASGLATTSAYTMSVEPNAVRSVRLATICVGSSNATAAAAVTVTVQRRLTASSGGTVATSEGTGTAAVSALEQGDGIYPGIVRITGTLGTAGPVLDQWSFMVGELGAGAADPTSFPVFCKSYGDVGTKPITIPQGVANGLSISVSASGSGGLAAGSIAATLLMDPQ